MGQQLTIWESDYDIEDLAVSCPELRDSCLLSYLSAEEFARSTKLENEISKLGGSKLQILDLVIGSGIGMAGALTQWAIQDAFYDQTKDLSEKIDTFRTDGHPIDKEGIGAFTSNRLGAGDHRMLYHDAFTFSSENPFVFNATHMDIATPLAVKDTFLHLLSDSFTKMGLPLPGIGNLPQNLRMDLVRGNRQLCEHLLTFNIGDVAGIGIVKFGTDIAGKFRKIEKKSMAYYQLKFISYSTYALMSAIIGQPNPFAFGLACWHGIKSIMSSVKLTSKLLEQSDLVLAASGRLSGKFKESLNTEQWAEFIASNTRVEQNLASQFNIQRQERNNFLDALDSAIKGNK